MKMSVYKNPNTDEFASIVEAVRANDGYCPCALEKNPDTKCMCKNFKDSEASDFCHCGKYYKIKDFEWLALIGDISNENNVSTFDTWMEMLAKQNFIVVPVEINHYNPFHLTEAYMDLLKAKIHKVDAVVILDDEEGSEWILELETWAAALNKRIIRRSELAI